MSAATPAPASAPAPARLADRFGHRRTLAGAAWLFALGSITSRRG